MPRVVHPQHCQLLDRRWNIYIYISFLQDSRLQTHMKQPVRTYTLRLGLQLQDFIGNSQETAISDSLWGKTTGFQLENMSGSYMEDYFIVGLYRSCPINNNPSSINLIPSSLGVVGLLLESGHMHACWTFFEAYIHRNPTWNLEHIDTCNDFPIGHACFVGVNASISLHLLLIHLLSSMCVDVYIYI